jgi:general secretion pathway protein D
MKKIIFLLVLTISTMFGDCNSKVFSLSTQGDNGIKIQTILSNLSDSCNLNIIIKDSVAKQKLSQTLHYVKLKNQTLKQFLKHILGENGFFWTLQNNTLTISAIKTVNFQLDYINSVVSGSSNFSASSQESDGSSNTINSTFDIDFWSDFSTNIDQILKSQSTKDFTPPTPIIDKTSGLVTVTGTKAQLNAIKTYINELNKRLHKEVIVDVRIYSIKLSKSHQTGVNWNKLSLSVQKAVPVTGNVGSTILDSTNFNLDGLLNFLSTYGQLNSISNPKITTLNNQKAIITVGSTINYSYKVTTTDKNGNMVQSDKIEDKFVGILLDITPEISNNGIIMMSIVPSISSLDNSSTQTNPNLPPNTIEKKLSTMVRVKNNSTIILGGLITDTKTLQRNGVPILKEIPLVKYLFSYESEISDKEELIFVITPHIVDLNSKIDISKLGYSLPKLGDF